MADGQVLKPDRDYSKEVDEQLPQAEELAKVLQRVPSLFRIGKTDNMDRITSKQPLKNS